MLAHDLLGDHPALAFVIWLVLGVLVALLWRGIRDQAAREQRDQAARARRDRAARRELRELRQRLTDVENYLFGEPEEDDNQWQR